MNPTVLDPCCGSRMMWFDKQDQRVLFGDQRTESHVLSDGRALEIKPDVNLDFRKLPFDDNTFRLIAFDPPHLVRAGKKSWLALKYGKLGQSWQDDLSKGFAVSTHSRPKAAGTATHLEFVFTNEPKPAYMLQMLWQMACTGRQWCDFVSYDDRLPEHLAYRCIRIERDNDKIAEIEAEVIAFLAELNEQINQLEKS